MAQDYAAELGGDCEMREVCRQTTISIDTRVWKQFYLN